MSIGNVPSRYDIALRTTTLDRVIEYEPADMTVTVEAGITFGVLQSLLAEHNQFLPIDAPADATVGGVLAANISGPSRHAYGLPRDWLIGCRVVLADGTIIKGGGRVVKNVAGYDIPKLAVGSLGTLGVIAEATFKLAPLPSVQETLIVKCETIESAGRLVFAADERSLALRALAIAGHEPIEGRTWTVGFWLAGTPTAVGRTRAELEQLGTTERGDGAWWQQEPVMDDTIALKASMLPSDVAAFCEHASVNATSVIAYPTTGLVDAALADTEPDESARRIHEARRYVVERGGSLVVTSAPAEVKRRIDVWGEVEGLDVMRALKQQFDPKSTLNPGRFVGGI
jgi:glycolate oxidase FAD binding subunit